MTYNNEVNFVLVLGNTGVGKTTFINTITKSNIFEISEGPHMCTKKCSIGRLTFKNKHNSFIDTPDFNNPYGKSENEINKAISENPNIKCIILLFNIHEVRIKQSTAELLEKLIKRFPIKNFWEHIIVVRTRVDEDCSRIRKYEREKNKNILLDFVNNEESMKNYMKNFGITTPYTIDEYYFGKSNEEGIEEDYKYNSMEFIKILNEINSLSPLN